MTEEKRRKSEKYTYIHEDKEKHRKFWTLVPCKFERGSSDFIMRKREREKTVRAFDFTRVISTRYGLSSKCYQLRYENYKINQRLR